MLSLLRFFISNLCIFPVISLRNIVSTYINKLTYWNLIGGVMVSVFPSSMVDHGFESWSGQTEDYKIGIYCFSAKHTALRRKSKNRLAWNRGNVSEWSDMSIWRLLFKWASTIKIQLSFLVRYKVDIIISLKLTCSRHDIIEKLLSWH